MRLFTATGGQTQEYKLTRLARPRFARRSSIPITLENSRLRYVQRLLIYRLRLHSLEYISAAKTLAAVKAQSTRLIRVKVIMPLSYAALRGPSVYASLDVCSILFFYYNDIFGIKVAFRRDKLRRHSATIPTKCVAPHMT